MKLVDYSEIVSIFLLLFCFEYAHFQNITTSWPSNITRNITSNITLPETTTIKSNGCLNNYDCLGDLICRDGLCRCPSGYLLNPEDNINCVEHSSTYHDFCSTGYDCSTEKDEICVSSRCQCAPDFKYNGAVKRCMSSRCYSSEDCQTYDGNRVCNHEKCVCGDGYEASLSTHLCDKKTKKNSKTYQKFCNFGYDCYEAKQRCVDHLCQCQPDYTFNEDTQSCEKFNCDNYPLKCSMIYDTFRHCDRFTETCICDDSYTPEPFNGNKCTYTLPTESPYTPYPPIEPSASSGTDLTWVYVTAGVVIVLGLIVGFASAARNAPSSRMRRVQRTNRTVQVDLGTSNPAMDVDNFYSVNIEAPRTPPPPYSP